MQTGAVARVNVPTCQHQRAIPCVLLVRTVPSAQRSHPASVLVDRQTLNRRWKRARTIISVQAAWARPACRHR